MYLQEPGKFVDSQSIQIPESHAGCMVCGCGDSLGLKFQLCKDGVEAFFQATAQWQGYRGVLHGGMICTLLDAAMTHYLFQQGIEAMTADLQVRFLKPVPCSGLIQLCATLQSRRHHLYQLSAQLICGGEIFARSEARFFQRKSA